MTNLRLKKFLESDIISEALGKVMPLFASSFYKLGVSANNIKYAINIISNENEAWIKRKDGLISLSHDENQFIDLEFYIVPRHFIDSNHVIKINLVENLFKSSNNNILILGDAGAGKTTSMKMVAKRMIEDSNYLENFSIPLVFKFSEFDFTVNQHFVLTNIQKQLSLEIGIGLDAQVKEVSPQFIRLIMLNFLESLNCLIIFDGFDEIPFQIQHLVRRELLDYGNTLTKSKIIFTSRTPIFDKAINNFETYEIAPFNPEQVQTYAQLALGKEKGMKFYSHAIDSKFNDTIDRPLILGYLITLYKYKDYLPENPKNLLQDIIDILFYKWDKHRDIHRPSRFGLEYYMKIDFCSHLAYEVSTNNKIEFNQALLDKMYLEIRKSFPFLPLHPDDVISEIREHSGIIIEAAHKIYKFPHKTIQEYLAAQYIVKYNPIDEILETLFDLPYETANAIVLSKNSSSFFINIIKYSKRKEAELMREYFKIVIERMINYNVHFIENDKLGYAVIELWVKFFKEHNDLFNSLIKIEGITKSFKLLEQTYQVNPSTYLDKDHMPNDLVAIYKRQSHNNNYKDQWDYSLKIPFKFVQYWKYFK